MRAGAFVDNVKGAGFKKFKDPVLEQSRHALFHSVETSAQEFLCVNDHLQTSQSKRSLRF